jgi:hypothetical protein
MKSNNLDLFAWPEDPAWPDRSDNDPYDSGPSFDPNPDWSLLGLTTFHPVANSSIAFRL